MIKIIKKINIMEPITKDNPEFSNHPNMIDENMSPETIIKNDVIRDVEYENTNIKSEMKKEEEIPPINSYPRKNQSFDRTRFKMKSQKTIFTEDFKPKKNIKSFIAQILESNLELLIMAIFTFFALFGSDLKSLFLRPKDDDIFNSIYLFVLILFLLEFFGNWFVKPTYVSTFFFWLDLMSIISLFLEIDWILNPLVDEFIL
jgi:hypothetical protein